MTSYLLVALLACGVIDHILGLDDGFTAEFSFDVQKRLLHMQFGVPSWRILGTTIGGTHSLAFGRISGSGIHRRFQRGEQIRLRKFGRGRLPPFLKLLVGQHIGGDHIQPTDQQTPVYDRKEKLIDRVANTRRSRRRRGLCDRPGVRLGYAEALPFDRNRAVVCCHGMFGNRLQISGTVLAKPFRIEACRVVADHQFHSAGFHALRYQIQ